MKSLFLFLCFAFYLPVANATKSNLHIAEEDSIRSSFVVGVEDLFWQTGWNYATIERMSVLLSTPHYGYYGPQPTFMLDGIPFEPDLFGVAFSQLFPVSFFKIDQNETLQGFGVEGGQPYSAGLMKLESEPVPDGFSVYASGQLGHNTGEPGPWVFDSTRVSPNVERFGPWIDAGASLRFGGWYAKGAIRKHSYLNIDEFVQTRLINLRKVEGQNLFLGVEAATTLEMAETGFQHDRGSVRLQAYRTDTDDFLYFQPMGREIPTGFETEQYSAAADFILYQNVGVRGLFQQRFHQTQFRENLFSHNFDWRKDERITRGSLFFDSNRFYLEAGASLTDRKVSARGMVSEALQTPGTFMQGSIQFHETIGINTSQQLQFYDDKATFMSSSQLEVEPVAGWKTTLSYQYHEMAAEESNPLQVWIGRGYDILGHLGIPLDSFAPPVTNKLLDLSITQTMQLPYRVQLFASAGTIRHYSLNIPFQPAEYELSTSTVPGAYSFYPSQSGNRLHLSFGLIHETDVRLSQEGTISFNRTLDGSQEYENYWKMVPEWKMQYSLYYTPYADLEIRMDLQYLSSREWPEFKGIDGEMNRSFHPQYPFTFFTFKNELPSHFKADIRVSKWLWQQRLRTALVLKNLFNTDYQTHPLGIRENFGYMARLEIRF